MDTCHAAQRLAIFTKALSLLFMWKRSIEYEAPETAFGTTSNELQKQSHHAEFEPQYQHLVTQEAMACY